MSYDECDTMFVFGLGIGAIFGGLVIAMMCFVAMTENAKNEYKQLLQDAGIQLERHYTETDGVRTNWTDVVFLDDKGNKALTMHTFRYQATPIKEQGKR